jgi:hypothetical protein
MWGPETAEKDIEINGQSDPIRENLYQVLLHTFGFLLRLESYGLMHYVFKTISMSGTTRYLKWEEYV